jgi:cell division protein FtsW
VLTRAPGAGGAASGGPRPSGRRAEPVRRLELVRGGAAAGRVPSGRAGRRPGDYVALASLVAILCVVGLVMVLSASSVVALSQFGSSWVIFERQALFVAIGAVGLLAAQRVDYRRWRRLAPALLAGSVLMLLAVLVPGVGELVSGSRRWLGVGPLRLQPSELAKLALVVFGADLFARRSERAGSWAGTTRPMLVVLVVVAGLVLKEPDMGTAVVLSCIVLVLLYTGGTPPRTLVTIGLAAVGGGIVLAYAEPYRRARLLSFLDPWAHASGSGYQVVQSLAGLGSGHLLGLGLGASPAKWGFLPNAYTDFIFAVLGEELGLLGSLLVVGLFVAVVVVGIRIAARAPDRFGGLLAAGITAWIGVQAVLNVGAVIGLLPVTGVPLPFVSFGGSSLVIEMVGVGILLNVAAHERPGGARTGAVRPADERSRDRRRASARRVHERPAGAPPASAEGKGGGLALGSPVPSGRPRAVEARGSGAGP